METPDLIEGEPSASGSHPTLSATDPDCVAKLVEELKSQGIFDDIRKECSAELDTKPSYHNMQNRVQTSIYNFLSKQNSNWNPSLNKPQIRNLLRKYLHNEQYMDAGVERIVDQTVNPKIYSIIEPLVESVVFQCLGLDQSDETANASNDFQNGNSKSGSSFIARPQAGSPSRMSTISSEDIEMQAVDSEGDGNRGVVSDGSSPGPAMRGNISPLTPDRAGAISNITNQTRTEDEVSDIEMTAKQLRGDISPLTPPPRQPKEDEEDDEDEDEDENHAGSSSPRTPPYPPPLPRVARTEQPMASEDQEMSPVSDTEFGDVSPPSPTHDTPDDASLTSPPLPPSQTPQSDFEAGTPPPPLPPPPPPPPPSDEALTPPLPPKQSKTHQSPFTSPIESSSDEMESSSKAPLNLTNVSSVSASDISDTDFACQSESEKGSASEEADLEQLERARAEIQAKIQAATLYESDEGEVHSEDEGHVKAGEPTKPAEDPCSISPVSDDMSDVQEEEVAQVEETEEVPLTPGQPEEVPEEVREAETVEKTDDEEEKSDVEEEPKIEHKDRKSDDDDSAGGAQGGESGPGPSTGDHFEEGGGSDGNQKKEERETQRRDSSHDKGKERRSSHHRHHSSSSKDGHHHHRRHSSSSSSKHKRDKDRKREDRKKEETSDPKEKKEKAKEREMKREKERIKFEKIESKISKSFTIKSEKYQAIDMFAPKNKPKVGLIISAVSPRPSFSTPIAAKSPPVFATKTIPSSSTTNPSTPQTPQKTKHVKEPESSSKHSKSDRHQDSKIDKSKNNKNSSEHHREVALSATSPIFERRILPELPVSKCDGDKQKQHMNDFVDTKRRLDEARQRRLETMKKEQETKKKMKQNSETKTPKSESSKSGKIKDRRRSSSDVHSSKHRPKKMEISGSDTSDDEWNRTSSKKGGSEKSSTDRKKKKKIEKRRFSDSSSGEEEPVPEVKEAPVMTRKLAHKTEADKVFSQDPTIPILYGFEAKERKQIPFEINEAELSDSSDIEDLIPLIPSKVTDNSLIYINNLASPEKALQILKAFGGKPKLVRSIPSWLESKLELWSLKRHDVDIIYPDEIQKIRNKRKILTEKEFEIRLGIYQSPEKQQQHEQQPSSMQIEDILMEQMPDIVTNSDDTLDTTNEVMAKDLIDETPLKRQKKVPVKKSKSAERVNGSQPQNNTDDSPLAKKAKTKRASKKSSEETPQSENASVEDVPAVEPIQNPSEVVHDSGPEDESDDMVFSKSLDGEELFHGFKKVSARKPQIDIKLDSIDVHGCSFGMSEDIVEPETETLKNGFEVRINQNFFDQAAKLLKGNIISELKKIKVDEPAANDHFGFREVDDEFLSDDILIPPPVKLQKLQHRPSPKPRTPRTKMNKTLLVPETEDGGGFPLPPSPVSSPSDGLVDADGDVNPSITADQLTAFHDAVSGLFCKMGSEALSISDIRQHVLTTTSLSESEMMACIKDMTRDQKMLQTANYFCLIK